MNGGREGGGAADVVGASRPGCVAAEQGSASRLVAERGSASLLVAVWVVVLAALAAAALVLTSVLAARESLAAATDLAALAGASATVVDPQRACARATSTARANGAVLTHCRVEGVDVWVTARAPAPASVKWLLPGRTGSLSARAHAELTADEP